MEDDVGALVHRPVEGAMGSAAQGADPQRPEPGIDEVGILVAGDPGDAEPLAECETDGVCGEWGRGCGERDRADALDDRGDP